MIEIRDEKHAARVAVAMCEQILQLAQHYQDYVVGIHDVLASAGVPHNDAEAALERHHHEIVAKVDAALDDVRRAIGE